MQERVTSVGEVVRLRLADLVAALSLGVDLGFGQPMEHVLRQCLIALRIADRAGLEEAERSSVYYTALLVGVGCHTDAHEQAKWFGDDIALKSMKYDGDQRSLRSSAAMLRLLGSGHQPLHRFRVGLEFVFGGFREVETMIEGHASMAQALARDLGLPVAVQDAVLASYERWDGHGWPGRSQAAAIPVASRICQLSEFLEVAHRLGGTPAAVELARDRAGSQFDPRLAELFVDDAEAITDGLAGLEVWDSVIAAEPALRMAMTPDEVDHALTGVADFVDLKTPFMLGHARAVTDLCQRAAAELSMRRADGVLLRRAATVHGFGRLGVSNAIWDKAGALGAGERERVRLHPYLTDRMLRQSGWLAPIGALAGQVRERLDGSGYPHGLAGPALSLPARVLAAADAYQSMREPRPYRPALTADEAEAELRREGAAGRLDQDAIAAVLRAAGHRSAVRRSYPAGLTTREVEILRLLAVGLSSRDIAERFVISPKTVRNHIEHIYSKTGATNRAAASLFAMQHDLLQLGADTGT